MNLIFLLSQCVYVYYVNMSINRNNDVFESLQQKKKKPREREREREKENMTVSIYITFSKNRTCSY